MPRVAFKTLGCKVNQVEAEQIAAALLGEHIELSVDIEADVIVVNTCTVTAEADHKARKAVRHALALAQQPVVVVTGCLATLDAEGLQSLGDRVVVEADKDAVAERVTALLAAHAPATPEAPATSATPDAPVARTGRGFHTRAMVKVEDGCDNFCAYCIVPFARGVPRSTPLADVVAEVEALVAAGVREVVLTGINIGRYDNAGAQLPELIQAVAATGIERIRLSSIEPPDVDAHFLQVVAALPAFCRHLHIPLQSGCDRTLTEMGRHYTVAGYTSTIARAREALPGLVLSTDILVGFPGETDADAAETFALLKRIGFAKLHVFRYSARPGTLAFTRDDRVSPRDAAVRSERVRVRGEHMRDAHLRAQVGTDVEVLVERVNADGIAAGVARDGSRVRLESQAAPGSLVSAHVTGVEGAVLIGTEA
ncbi:MAG: MiaB/RimO family radical SAM methylthiotransferase [Actinomycetota bacterium]|nr:MiaB/RimO family radical SAM methylthiotransferase [Actinomycetota bacterium]